jgi:hypothetical protein
MSDKASIEQAKEEKNLNQFREKTLNTRMKQVLLAETTERGRYSSLEFLTGIPAPTWRTWWTRASSPNGLLVEAVAKAWPQYAFWMITGQTDIRCGHDMPKLSIEAQGYISNWPEEGSQRIKKIKSSYSKEYLKLLTQISEGLQTIEYEMKIANLHMLSVRRQKEIEENFQVPLAFEESKRLV